MSEIVAASIEPLRRREWQSVESETAFDNRPSRLEDAEEPEKEPLH